MKPFAYLLDPLFLFCLVLYFVNRLIIKHWLPNPFSQFWLNDLICIPFWVPIMLTAMRKTGMRKDDHPPQASEIIIPLLIWSFVFECVAPYTRTFQGLAFGDPADILCYTLGALAAAIFWRFHYKTGKPDVLPPKPAPARRSPA